MAKAKSSNGGFMTGAAEMIGGALGTIVGKINRLTADGPHPPQDAKKTLPARPQQVIELAGDARNRPSAGTKTTKAATTRVRKGAGQSRPPGSKILKQAKPATPKIGKRGNRVVRRATKTPARRRAGARRK